jgi:hypothetical protein
MLPSDLGRQLFAPAWNDKTRKPDSDIVQLAWTRYYFLGSVSVLFYELIIENTA